MPNSPPTIYIPSTYLPSISITHLPFICLSVCHVSYLPIHYLSKAEFICPPILQAYLCMWIVGNCSPRGPFSTSGVYSEAKYIIMRNFWWTCVDSTWEHRPALLGDPGRQAYFIRHSLVQLSRNKQINTGTRSTGRHLHAVSSGDVMLQTG